MKLPYLPQDDLALDAARRGETGAGRGRCGLGTDRTSRRTAANGLEPRTRARELCRFPSWCLGLLPKTGAVLSLLLDLPRLPARPALWIVYHTYKLLKSQSGTRKGCGAPGWTTVPPPSANWTPKILGCMPNSMLFRPAFHSQNQQQRDRRSQCAACRLKTTPVLG